MISQLIQSDRNFIQIGLNQFTIPVEVYTWTFLIWLSR